MLTLQVSLNSVQKWIVQCAKFWFFLYSDDRVPTELKKAIMQARIDKKLTQSQLAQLINEKPQVIQEYESGKAIPNQQIISKLERALGAKLRGKK
ncbi:multiprotein-bridging factor 1a-like [Primulina tabacum]|uniref:multiprotein-bridging factor 1a-like n=1 Tax=Primulina tabacum TaxID=48773 RepID=UPI003F591105